MRTSRMTLGAAVVVTTALIGVPAVNATPDRKPVPPLPNLTVSKASVSLSHGRLTGSFTVGNSGKASAGRSKAQLSITVGKASRSLAVFTLPALKPRHAAKTKVSVAEPTGLRPGKYPLTVCADSTKAVRESSERDNCARVGTLTVPAVLSVVPVSGTTTVPATAVPTSNPTPTQTSNGLAPTPTEPQPGPTQQPTDPLTINADTATLVQDSYDGMTGSYYVDIPPSYDTTGATPMRLLVWMHGCGGDAEGDTYETTASNTPDAQGHAQVDDSRDFISISIGGTDGGCWNVDTDVEKVLMAIADVTTHFNIDRRHIFIAGYSSGGDLAWRTIFYNADEFAGILTVNTNPFRDTGSTEAQSLAASAWKFNIAHVAHAQDDEYHVDPCTDCIDDNMQDDPGVTPAMDDLANAGYPVQANVTYIIEPGTHSDPDNFQDGTGTYYDWRQYVRPFIDNANWISPG